jgi:hypothetical protein
MLTFTLVFILLVVPFQASALQRLVLLLAEETARLIGEKTWKQQGDIRDVISVSKLVKKQDGPDEIVEIIKTLAKYGG